MKIRRWAAFILGGGAGGEGRGSKEEGKRAFGGKGRNPAPFGQSVTQGTDESSTNELWNPPLESGGFHVQDQDD